MGKVGNVVEFQMRVQGIQSPARVVWRGSAPPA